MEQAMIRPQAETRYWEELEALAAADEGNRKPLGWKLSPKAVRDFILGRKKPLEYMGREISIGKKYLGNDALVERCIITLTGSRGLMLVGEPGTAKTLLSELLSAAISGVSTNTIQGTARDIIDNQNANYRGLMDFMVQRDMDALRAENQTLKLAASQANQNNVIGARIDAATAEILRRTGAECPTAAYIVQPPTPVNFPVNNCGQFAGWSNGGCDCGGNRCC